MNLSAGKVATAIATAEAMPTTEANGNWNAVYFFYVNILFDVYNVFGMRTLNACQFRSFIK